MSTTRRRFVVAAALGAAAMLAGCWERPPTHTEQHGYRGTGMVNVGNPRTEALVSAANQAPAAIPALPPAGTLAKDSFKNVQVLGDLDSSEFTRTMLAITSWVAPEQGCNYCHAPGEDLSSDKLYTKVVARKMLQMTRKINADWKPHVAETGVTCYTCHHGKPVPANLWFQEAGTAEGKMYAGRREGQNRPGATVALAALPVDPFTPYLEKAGAIRIAAQQALPQKGVKGATIQQTELTYALMTHMSKALGVNCTYCHNSRSFGNWDESTPQRVTAWHGIRMVRELNNAHLDPLKGTFPANRLGPTGDAPKANCQTCHQGVFKPLYGAPMAKEYPALTGVAMVKTAAAAAAPAPAPAAQPAAGGPLARVLFASGKSSLDAAAREAIAAAVKALKGNAALTVDLSGFADKVGSPAKNLDLAKERAQAVRAAI
jgi:photosynthetic reaction center cytochrome c subunit